jgi:hypothetical protein
MYTLKPLLAPMDEVFTFGRKVWKKVFIFKSPWDCLERFDGLICIYCDKIQALKGLWRLDAAPTPPLFPSFMGMGDPRGLMPLNFVHVT